MVLQMSTILLALALTGCGKETIVPSPAAPIVVIQEESVPRPSPCRDLELVCHQNRLYTREGAYLNPGHHQLLRCKFKVRLACEWEPEDE